MRYTPSCLDKGVGEGGKQLSLLQPLPVSECDQRFWGISVANQLTILSQMLHSELSR